MSRNNTSLANLLIDAPWWVSVLFAALVYILAGHVIPSVETQNPMSNMVFKALAIPAPYFAFFILLIAPFSFLNSRRKAKQLDVQTDIDSIRHLHWRNFEELVAEAYRRKGYRVIEGGYGADGGIDLELEKDGQVTLVQCKHWKTQKVGVSVIREMFGVLSASNAQAIIIVCTGKFSQQAREFAHAKPITLITGSELARLVKDVQPSPQIETVNQTVCPSCGGDLVHRMAKRGSNAGNYFLGCSNFPRCRYTRELSS